MFQKIVSGLKQKASGSEQKEWKGMKKNAQGGTRTPPGI